MDIKPSSWTGLDDIEDLSIRYYEPLIEQEQGKSILNEEDIPDIQYEIEDYKPLNHIFNIHSITDKLYIIKVNMTPASTGVIDQTNPGNSSNVL